MNGRCPPHLQRPAAAAAACAFCPSRKCRNTMPDTYQIKLSDGRTFNVTTEGGPPSEADVLANLDKLTTSTPSAVMQPSAGRGTQFDPELANRRFPSVLP